LSAFKSVTFVLPENSRGAQKKKRGKKGEEGIHVSGKGKETAEEKEK